MKIMKNRMIPRLLALFTLSVALVPHLASAGENPESAEEHPASAGDPGMLTLSDPFVYWEGEAFRLGDPGMNLHKDIQVIRSIGCYADLSGLEAGKRIRVALGYEGEDEGLLPALGVSYALRQTIGFSGFWESYLNIYTGLPFDMVRRGIISYSHIFTFMNLRADMNVWSVGTDPSSRIFTFSTLSREHPEPDRFKGSLGTDISLRYRYERREIFLAKASLIKDSDSSDRFIGITAGKAFVLPSSVISEIDAAAGTYFASSRNGLLLNLSISREREMVRFNVGGTLKYGFDGLFNRTGHAESPFSVDVSSSIEADFKPCSIILSLLLSDRPSYKSETEGTGAWPHSASLRLGIKTEL